MAKRISALFVVGLLCSWSAAPGPAAPVPKDGDKPRRFFPVTSGTQWVYRMSDQTTTIKVTFVISNAKADGETFSLSIGEVLDKGRIRPSEDFIVSSKGLFLAGDALGDYDPPLCLVQYPGDPGTAWKNKSLCRKGTIENALAIGELEEVEVPAGKFKAYPVTCKHTAVLTWEGTFWYAPGVGVVKKVYNPNSDRKVEFALISFKPGEG